jgi:hypothetical protein
MEVMVATYRSATSKLGIWVIHSGASHNYCNNIKDFQKDSVTESKILIKLRDNNTVQANKKGIVPLNGVDIEAFFVSEFRISLLSVSQLDKSGLTVTFRSGVIPTAFWMSCLQPHTTHPEKGKEIWNLLQFLHDAGIRL